MNYFSLHKKAPNTTFEDAVVRGLAPDKGLYFPESITPLSKDFIENIENYSNHEIAYEAIRQFVGDEIPGKKLKHIIEDTLCFEFPVVPVDTDISSLDSTTVLPWPLKTWALVLWHVVWDISTTKQKTRKM